MENGITRDESKVIGDFIEGVSKLNTPVVLADVSCRSEICDICGTKPTKNCSICRQETA